MKRTEIDGKTLKKLFKAGMDYLEMNKEAVNALNVFPVPDGDTGTNMSLTIKSAVEQALSVESDSASDVANGASLGSLMGARGNSGVILSQLFRGFAAGISGYETITTTSIAEGLRQATNTAYKAVMKPVEGTILTVAKDLSKSAINLAKKESNLIIFLEKVIESGKDSLARTPDLLPVLKESNVVDAGGMGLVYFLQGIHLCAIGKVDIEITSLENMGKIAQVPSQQEELDSEIEFGYCTEFMIEVSEKHTNNLRTLLDKLGNSLMVVGDQGLIKVHLHTNHPGEALEAALSYGPVRDIKIDNMRYQHNEIIKKELEEKIVNNELKEYGIITVASGDGLEVLFKELHADYVILGGQTMNPSTQDFVNAIEQVNAKEYILLPNNKNIILAAEQAKMLSEKSINVLPTKTIVQGISALIGFNDFQSIENNLENMKENMEHVKSGQITYAVRDTSVNGLKISKDDIIGIAEGDIISSGKDINEVTLDVVEELIFDDASMITLIYGKDMQEEAAVELIREIEDKYDDYDVELIYGGQPVYYYYVSID